MKELKTQKDFQTVFNSLSFCYLCGEPFQNLKSRDRDHVPPKNVFQVTDRHAPLILPAHLQCNRDQSVGDEEIGKLIGLLHGKPIYLEKSRLKIGTTKFPDNTQAGVVPINMKQILYRWIRGFHAAIYNDFLPAVTKGVIHLPMPSLKLEGNTVRPEKDIFTQQYQMVEALKMNRAVDRLDRIECWNGKCIYECFWRQAHNEAWCVFALKIYNWKDLGDPVHSIQRGCCGLYVQKSIPKNATIGVSLVIPILNFDKLDPFGN